MAGEIVAVNRYTKYDSGLTDLIYNQLKAIGVTEEMLRGKKIVLKPNLVMNKNPQLGATTHPDFLSAAVFALRKFGALDFLIAESSGGPYTESTLKNHYNGCGITGAANACGAALNYDTSAQIVNYSLGKTCRRFNIIKPIAEAEIIVNLCKLKTHSLTKMTCAVKNFYGVIPGTEKFEMHAGYSNPDDFRSMLLDLCEAVNKDRCVINLCDGIIGMEGNGPTGGTPRDYGVVLASLSPYALDLAAEYIMGFEGTVPTVKMSQERGHIPLSADELNAVGDSIQELKLSDVIEPETAKKSWLTDMPNILGGRFAAFFSPRPKINTGKCVGCGECVRSCPRHTIELVNKNGKKKAKINPDNCILCYCCQELCPVVAVDIKKNPFLKLIH